MNKALEPYYGMELGIVVQNNDPEFLGRVKVYTPSLAPYLDKAYSSGENKNVDKFFAFLGKNTGNTAIEDVLVSLKEKLPWAEPAGPLFSGNASGRYNAYTQQGTTSDSNAWDGTTIVDGFRPVQNWIGQFAASDGFTSTGGHKNKFVNQYAYQYTPSNYSGLARGLFSIPNVGAHVWIFYVAGDRNFPVYFAASYGQEDIQRIYTLNQGLDVKTAPDHPGSFENVSDGEGGSFDEDAKTFRSKTVLNTNKHTIELIDTDLREIMKFTHYSGSFKEFNNYANIEFATNNDQKLVMGDQFATVTRNKSEYVKVHNELIVGGDYYINIGETDQSTVQEILNIHKQIHDYKMLFDVKRAQYGEAAPFGNLNVMSTKQTRSGFTGVDEAGVEYLNGFKYCPICKNIAYDPYDVSYVDGGDFTTMWKEVRAYIAEICTTLPVETGEEELPTGGEEAIEELEEMTPVLGPICHTFFMTSYPDVSEAEMMEGCVPTEHPFEGQLGYYRGMKCACCAGTGFSPSTEGGSFDKETMKQAGGAMDTLIQQYAPTLSELEKKLGNGGDEIETVSMNKIITVGLAMNDMTSYRVDPIGKLKIDGCYVAPQGTYDNFKVSPHVEYVDVADIPGGDYILTCMNKYKLLVGARGVNIQTFGPIDIYGTIVNMTGEQMNISSRSEIVLDGGERLSIRARKISLIPVEHNAVVVEGQLHVTRNTILEGGIMLEGEVGLLHITAPAEWHITENGLWEVEPTCVIPAIVAGTGETFITIPPHKHYFQNIPMTLLQHPEAVRETMIVKGINSREKIAAASVAQDIGTSCSSTLIKKINTDFLDKAWEKAKSDATAKGVDLGNCGGINYDSGNAYRYGGPITGTNQNTCSVVYAADGSTISYIDVSMTYFWSCEQKSGYVTVTGSVTEDGEIISGPN